MKQIGKNPEPRSLIRHRAAGGTFDNLHADDKEELRQSLKVEQGYICCYCMKRIPLSLSPEEIETNTPDCKIEHFNSQTRYEDQQLNYQNLLLACHGNQGSPRIMQTCDTYKGEAALTYNPASHDRNIESLVKYNANGEIYSKDEVLNRELTQVLNLNTKDLRDARKVMYLDVHNRIVEEGRRRIGQEIQKTYFISERERLLTKVRGKFLPYCMIGVYLIDKKLKRLS